MTPIPTRAARLAVAAALAATAACAAVEAPPTGPSPFLGVKKLVLVRRVEDPEARRPRDALDALKESLDARAYATRVVEVGPGQEAAARELERLEERIAARLGRERAGLRGMGRDAGAVVASLGVDAVAGYHRLEGRLAPLPPPPDPWGPSAIPEKRAAETRRPVGALSVVATDGSVAWFPWGGPGAELEHGALVNAAEAIDAVLAVLSGETGEDG